jgi:hypothetical protein
VTNRILFATVPIPGSTVPAPVLIVATTTKRKKAITHDDLAGLTSILFHVDLEHGGDYCGVLQISVVAYNPSEAKVIGEFDEYIKPPANATWSDHASEVHGIYPNDVRITSAMGIVEVWKRFVLFIEGHLADGAKKGIIAAWGGGNPAIASGCFASRKTCIMAYYSCPGGARTSWTPKRSFHTTVAVN